MEIKKSPDSKIDNKSMTFILLGGLVVLAVMLSSFELKTAQLAPKELPSLVNDMEDEEVIEVQLDLSTPPPPPPPPPPPAPDIVEVVEDEEEVEETLVVNEVDVNEKIEIVDIPEPEPEPEVDNSVYDMASIQKYPEYPGGEEKMYEFLGSNLKYPQMAKEAGVKGRVYIQFVVERDGSVSDVKTVRGIGGGCDEEAERVVKMMPKWSPGEQAGKPVRVKYTLPVLFRLQ